MTAAGAGLGSAPTNISSARTATISDSSTSPGQLLELLLEQGVYFQPVHSGAIAARLQRDAQARGALLTSPPAVQALIKSAARTVAGFKAGTQSEHEGGVSTPSDPFSVWTPDTFRGWLNSSAHLISKCAEDAAADQSIDSATTDNFLESLAFVLVEAMSQHGTLLREAACASPALPLQVLRRLGPFLSPADLHAGEQAAVDALQAACASDAPPSPVAVRQALSTYIRWKQAPFPLPREMGRFMLRQAPSFDAAATPCAADGAPAKQRLQALQDAARELLVASQIQGAAPAKIGGLQNQAAAAAAAVSEKHLRQPAGWLALLDCVWAEAQVAQRRASSGRAQRAQAPVAHASVLDTLEKCVAGPWASNAWGPWRLRGTGPEHLVRCAWAAGKLRPLAPPLASWLEEWAVRTHATQYLGSNDLAVLAWSMQNTAAHLPRMWRALEHAAMQAHELPDAETAYTNVTPPEAPPLEEWPFPALCLFAQAAASAHQGSPHMWALLMRALAARRHEFAEHPGTVPRILSVFRSRGSFPPRLTRDLLSAARRSITALSPAQLGAVLQSCESSNLPAKKMFKQTARLLLAATSSAGDIKMEESKRTRLAWRGALQAAADSNNSNAGPSAWFTRGAVSHSTASSAARDEPAEASDSELDMSGSDSDASSDSSEGGAARRRTANLAQMLPTDWRGGNLKPAHVTELLHLLARVDRCPWRLLESVAWWLLHDVPDEMRDVRSCVLLADALVLSRHWCAPLLQALGKEVTRLSGGVEDELVARVSHTDGGGSDVDDVVDGAMLGLASAHGGTPGGRDGPARAPLVGMSQRDWVALHRVLSAMRLCCSASEHDAAAAAVGAFPIPVAQYAAGVAAALQGSRGAILPQNALVGLSRYLDLRGLPAPQSGVIHADTGYYLPFSWPQGRVREAGIALFFDVPSVFSVAAAKRGAVLMGGAAGAGAGGSGGGGAFRDENGDMAGSALRAGASSALAFTGSSSHAAHRGQRRARSPHSGYQPSNAAMSRSDLRVRPAVGCSVPLGTVDVGDPSSGPSREVQFSRLKLKPVHLLERHCLLAAGLHVVSVPFTAWAEVSPADAWRLVSAKGSVPLCDDEGAGKVGLSLEHELDAVLLPLLREQQ